LPYTTKSRRGQTVGDLGPANMGRGETRKGRFTEEADSAGEKKRG